MLILNKLCELILLYTLEVHTSLVYKFHYYLYEPIWQLSFIAAPLITFIVMLMFKFSQNTFYDETHFQNERIYVCTVYLIFLNICTLKFRSFLFKLFHVLFVYHHCEILTFLPNAGWKYNFPHTEVGVHKTNFIGDVRTEGWFPQSIFPF